MCCASTWISHFTTHSNHITVKVYHEQKLKLIPSYSLSPTAGETAKNMLLMSLERISYSSDLIKYISRNNFWWCRWRRFHTPKYFWWCRRRGFHTPVTPSKIFQENILMMERISYSKIFLMMSLERSTIYICVISLLSWSSSQPMGGWILVFCKEYLQKLKSTPFIPKRIGVSWKNTWASNTWRSVHQLVGQLLQESLVQTNWQSCENFQFFWRTWVWRGWGG